MLNRPPYNIRPDYGLDETLENEIGENEDIEKPRTFLTALSESKLIVLFYLVIIGMVLCVFLCLVKKLRSIDDDDCSDVQT